MYIIFQKRKRKNIHQNAERVEYKDIVKENPLFEKYYKVYCCIYVAQPVTVTVCWCAQEQKLVPDGEWDQFMETLRNSLPATFRITSTTNKYVLACLYIHIVAVYLELSYSDAYCLKQCLQERFFTELHKIEVDGERVPMPQPIPWYIAYRCILHVHVDYFMMCKLCV